MFWKYQAQVRLFAGYIYSSLDEKKRSLEDCNESKRTQTLGVTLPRENKTQKEQPLMLLYAWRTTTHQRTRLLFENFTMVSSNGKPQKKTQKESWAVYLAFFNFAISVYLVFIILLTGSQDILAGTRIQTSWVLFADITPSLLIPLIIPFFAAYIPYSSRIITVFLLYLTAFLCLGLVKNAEMKLAAVALASFGAGILDTSAIGLTSYFKPSILSWYATSSGAGFLTAPIYYTSKSVEK